MTDPEREGEEGGAVAVPREPDFTKKHPLEHRWTLWFDNKSKGRKGDWGADLCSVYTVDSVEDFWCLYNNIVTPGRLHYADMHMFKEGIKPAWEDSSNAQGGNWIASVKPSPNAKQCLDQWWLNSLLALIGEQFAEGLDICGISAVVRRGKDRLALWTKTGSNELTQISIGKDFKKFLGLSEEVTIGYVTHADAEQSGSKAKDRYSV